MQDLLVSTRQPVQVLLGVHVEAAVHVTSGNTGTAAVPWPDFHFRTCRSAPPPELNSTKATLVPSRDSTGEVVIAEVPVVAVL